MSKLSLLLADYASAVESGNEHRRLMALRRLSPMYHLNEQIHSGRLLSTDERKQLLETIGAEDNDDPYLVILDVDGVLTNGTKTYNNAGEIVAKDFCDLDFTGIKMFKRRGDIVCWLSADKTVNKKLAKNRGIDFWFGRSALSGDHTINKVAIYRQITEHYKKIMPEISARKTIYVGDDLLDVPLMEEVLNHGGLAVCPQSGNPRLSRIPGVVRTVRSGGAGVVMELYDRMYPGCDDIPCN